MFPMIHMFSYLKCVRAGPKWSAGLYHEVE